MSVKLIFGALLLESASAANILALMVTVSRSHHMWNTKYLEALGKRGHQVTYFSVDKYVDPPENITQILVENTYETLHENFNVAELRDSGPYEGTVLLYRWNDEESEFIMRSEALKELKRVVARKKFDLVVHDLVSGWFLLGAVDALGRPPVVGITAFGTPTLALAVLGNPVAYATMPHHLCPHSDKMSLWQRANNFFLHMWALALDSLLLRKESDRSRMSFGPDVRPVKEIMADINVIFVNYNHAIDFPFPRVPGLVPVGGLHIQEPKPLPQDLKTFLDGAEDGVIYFSLGTNIKSSALGKEKVGVLVEAFRRMSPVQVLWKWERDLFFEKPANVKTAKWLPQNDVLAHPNVRLFFTHSGLLSTQEALYHGKPTVGMPFFLDQHVNADRSVERRFGEKLDLDSLTVDGVVAALRKVLDDPQYAENAKKASAIFKDERDHPLDRAVYWTEYVIRHRGASHLRYAARELRWYQIWMLDVLVLTISGVFFVSFAVYKLIAAVRGPKKEQKAKRN